MLLEQIKPSSVICEAKTGSQWIRINLILSKYLTDTIDARRCKTSQDWFFHNREGDFPNLIFWYVRTFVAHILEPSMIYF